MKDKKVTNLLDNMAKARDILATNDFKEVYKNLRLFQNIRINVIRQVSKYVSEASHELDFTYQDLKELSDEIHNFIKYKHDRFTFDKHFEKIMSLAPVTGDAFNEFSRKLGMDMEVHTQLSSIYKTLSYLAIVVFLWSDSSEKKPIEKQLLDTLRSFI